MIALPDAQRIIAPFEGRISPEPNTGCWLWTGASLGNGDYGSLRIHGRTRYAHRMFYEWFKGPIPEGLQVLHDCDTPQCVNPDHLAVGTQKQNMDDMRRKGRASYWAKLRAPEMLAIRYLRMMGHAPRDLARAFGVTSATISKVWLGQRRWS